jgi:hypothetical protein
MEHKPLAELHAVALVDAIDLTTSMSRDQRLERWLSILESEPERRLRSLHEIEYLPRTQRRECRADNSPLTVAYEDPVLRAAGLRSDRVGDCTDFFGLSDRQMHDAFCSCHVGFSLTGEQAAQRLHRVLRMDRLRARVREVIGSAFRSVFGGA